MTGRSRLTVIVRGSLFFQNKSDLSLHFRENNRPLPNIIYHFCTLQAPIFFISLTSTTQRSARFNKSIGFSFRLMFLPNEASSSLPVPFLTAGRDSELNDSIFGQVSLCWLKLRIHFHAIQLQFLYRSSKSREE